MNIQRIISTFLLIKIRKETAINVNISRLLNLIGIVSEMMNNPLGGLLGGPFLHGQHRPSLNK